MKYLGLLLVFISFHKASAQPNIILLMTDDQGWGQTGYNGHPILKTPNLDAMASSGLRFNRFYAAAPVCSPTRASVLTGRTNMRTGVRTHGFALRRQEKTLAQALQRAGYATGHFGKWHLNGMRGPGVPILGQDRHHPGHFGFDHWLSVTNFFDRDPILSRQGDFEEFQGDSSEIVVAEATKFIEAQVAQQKPFFSVIWFGTPHNPFRASDQDTAPFRNLARQSRLHYGELVALDRSIGTLRKKLRELHIAADTLVWFCSDNGGLSGIQPDTVGGLRGHKGSLYEGGLRVPGIVEWPGRISPRATDYPAVVMDISPTISDLLNLPTTAALQPQDGISLVSQFDGSQTRRAKPIPFQCFGNTAIIDNQYKLLELKKDGPRFELYDLSKDPHESQNLYVTGDSVAENREIAAIQQRMKKQLEELKSSITSSMDGQDYPEGKVMPGDPEPRFWTTVEAYQPYFADWIHRPEYKSRLEKQKRSSP